MTSEEIYPLAQRLYALIPEPLRYWPAAPGDPGERDRLADNFLMELAAVPGAPIPDDDPEGVLHALIISEALAGFVTQWGGRYGHLDDDVDRAQAALVTSLGGVVHEPGYFSLALGTPLTVAAIAHLIGWVTILEVPEV
jgi:hypothetical protein